MTLYVYVPWGLALELDVDKAARNRCFSDVFQILLQIRVYQRSHIWVVSMIQYTVRPKTDKKEPCMCPCNIYHSIFCDL